MYIININIFFETKETKLLLTNLNYNVSTLLGILRQFKNSKFSLKIYETVCLLKFTRSKIWKYKNLIIFEANIFIKIFETVLKEKLLSVLFKSVILY